MIVVNLLGGLGNQMFQYALGRSLSLHSNSTLKLDTSRLASKNLATPREYSLSVFSINPQFTTKEEVKKLTKQNQLIETINKYTRFSYSSQSRRYYSERNNKYDDGVFNLKGDIYLSGYWQSEKYFQKYSEEIRTDFTFQVPPSDSNKRLIAKINSNISISLHVRRGDYISDNATNKFHGTCSLDYYKQATSYIDEEVKDPHYFIFSDDIAWSRKNIPIQGKATFVDNNQGGKSYEDMRLMSLCKHNIIANSSFSWWGAWLNRNPNKVVIAPKKWFKKANLSTQDLIPESWVQL